eukprot:12916711-Prorocentrum_lima.AAC.1
MTPTKARPEEMDAKVVEIVMRAMQKIASVISRSVANANFDINFDVVQGKGTLRRHARSTDFSDQAHFPLGIST